MLKLSNKPYVWEGDHRSLSELRDKALCILRGGLPQDLWDVIPDILDGVEDYAKIRANYNARKYRIPSDSQKYHSQVTRSFAYRFRYVHTNLCLGPNAPWVREQLEEGIILPRMLAHLGKKELNPQGWKKVDDILRNSEKKSSLEVELKKEQVESSQVVCGRCRSQQVEYRQLQTRSADEGLTTRFECMACGLVWKVC